MKRDNHYEAAFEWFLRDRGVGFVAVDEARRTLLDDESVKSLDFIIVGPQDAKLVVDVKGRVFPGTSNGKQRRVWQNWAEAEDIDGLERWATRFGPGFRGVLAFVYHIRPCVELPPETPDLFTFRDRVYLARGIDVTEYRARMKRRSPRWGTVHLHADDFREVVRPFSTFLERVNHRDTENTEEGRRSELHEAQIE
ncbi:MAG TPA: HYExAFE family protein [Gemmataceae bacterium]|nr:HYExAFE family protein [Gemmataceae bacterium]